MKQTKLIMGMPISVEIIDTEFDAKIFDKVFDWFRSVDARFSTYKPTSEISQINRGLPRSKWSQPMKQIFKLAEQTKRQTDGYFDISHGGQFDPSGLVKGWAIQKAAELLHDRGIKNFYVDAGGDIQVAGHSAEGGKWRVGVRNPFDRAQIVKAVVVECEGVATSGTYIRGQHIYNPHRPKVSIDDIVSITVVGPNIYEADRMATAAYAMGSRGIGFIESLDDFEAYMINASGIATMTSRFERFVI